MTSSKSQGWTKGGLTSSAAAIRTHIGFLASDLLNGRKPGTLGYHIAASYVTAQLAMAGARPAGTGVSYLQPVPLVRYGATGSPKLIVRRSGGKPIELLEGEDFRFRGWPGHPHIKLSGQLAFGGYRIVAPELDRDDFAGLDLAGKIVIVLEGLPSGLPDAAARYESAALQREAAGKCGAVGVVFMDNLRRDPPTPAPSLPTIGEQRAPSGLLLHASWP